MTIFRGKWSDRLGMILISVVGFSGFYLFCLMPPTPERNNSWEAHLFANGLGLVCLATGGFCIYSLLESFTTYRLDPDKIERRGLLFNSIMLWKRVSEMKTKGTPGSEITLTDDRGKRLNVYPSLVKDPNGTLSEFIKERCSSLYERKLQAFDTLEKTYTPGRGFPAVICFVTAISLMGAAIAPLFYRSEFVGEEGLMLVCLLLFGSMGILCGYGFLHSLTHSLVLTSESLISHSVFRHREIKLDRITSFYSRTLKTQNGTTYSTTIEGSGQKISFAGGIEDYGLIRDYLERRAGEAAKQTGLVEEPLRKHKENRQALIFISAVSLIGLGGIGLHFLNEANTRLEKHNALDRRGVWTEGHARKKAACACRNKEETLNYDFVLNGHTYQNYGTVSEVDYEKTHDGQIVRIIYLPDHPESARLSNSIGRQKAETDRKSAFYYIGLAFAYPLLFLALLAQKGKRPSKTVI